MCRGFFRSILEESSVLDDIGGAEGDRTPDLKTASLMARIFTLFDLD